MFKIDEKVLCQIAERPATTLGKIIGKDKLTQLHDDWINSMWRSQDHIALQAHRGSFKTTSVVLVGILFYLLFFPFTRIAVVRKKMSQSAEILATVAKAFGNPAIRKIYEFAHRAVPTMIIQKAERLTFSFKRTNTPEGSVDAYGIETGITGKHYDVILCDDIITMADRYSPAERRRTKRIVSELQTNIIEPSGHIIYTGTPWHQDDAWGMIPDPQKFDVYQTGILSDTEIAEKRKTSLSNSLFACNYELKYIDEETAMFSNIKHRHWEGYTNVIGHIDAAFSGTDSTAVTFASLQGDDIIIVGFCFEENIKDKWAYIQKLYHIYDCGTMYNETNADKGFVADKLRSIGLLIKTYHEKQNKHIKIITHLGNAWEHIYIDTEKSDDTYIAQVAEYFEGVGQDDAPDSIASLIREHYSRAVKEYQFDFQGALAI